MRSLLIGTAVIAGVVFGGTAQSSATLLSSSVVNGPNALVTPVENVGYWRRLYRHGYIAPYVYYPPAYGYYAPAPAYAYYPPGYAYAPPPAFNYPPAYGDHAPTEEGGYTENPPVQGYEEPPPEDGGYAENPPAHRYEAPPPGS
jgi:hypothetical protein